MIRLRIDNRPAEVAKGTTVFEAAEKLGINIPAMCYNSEAGHFASCMICMVKDNNSRSLIPSCSSLASEGMDITTGDKEIHLARKTALELLLSEHSGDCEAPCRIACPANMNIPLMNQYIARGDTASALETVMEDIAMPSVLGRICPAPCEGACHRKTIDKPVSICHLKRIAGDFASKVPERTEPGQNGKVAIIGAGIAGLSATWYLQSRGFRCSLYDSNPLPGGALRYQTGQNSLDTRVLDREAGNIIGSGVDYHPGTKVDKARFKEITQKFDAVVVATGNYYSEIGDWGLANNGKQVTVEKRSYLTSLPKVFAVGNVNRNIRLAIRSAAQGKEVAFSIGQLLAGSQPEGEPKLFNSRAPRLQESEFSQYLSEAPNNTNGGLTGSEASREASRCLHCECLKPVECKLRILAGEYGAKQRRFNFEKPKPRKKITDHNEIIFESGKCIKCGICVRLSAKYNELPGLAYVGRGYDVTIEVPFDQKVNEAIKTTGSKLAGACPTGAIAIKKH